MDGWTLEELVDRAAQALATADVRAPNGRVTAVPDARLIRWYATIGLMDRPSSVKGRSAYGPRHLLQLVAIKRLQSAGAKLEQIQQRLAGATEDTLRAIADVPDGKPRARFWAEQPRTTFTRDCTGDPTRDAAALVHGVRIGQLTLLLSKLPADEDLDAIAEAARPLLDLLVRLGLLTEGAQS